MSLAFYDVDNTYANYLRSIEPKIPNIRYANNDKFLCGIVLEVNGFKYYAPISSFKINQLTNILIYHNQKAISSIRFSYMFPCPDDVLAVKDFSLIADSKYRNLLIDEYNYCVGKEKEIVAKANYIYKRYLSGHDTLLLKNCCNFPLLEAACMKYSTRNTL